MNTMIIGKVLDEDTVRVEIYISSFGGRARVWASLSSMESVPKAVCQWDRFGKQDANMGILHVDDCSR